MQETAGRKMATQALEKFSSQPELGRTESRGVPLFAIHVVDRNESGLAAHREPHVSSGNRYPETNRAARPNRRRIWTRSHAVSRHEPHASSSVCSGVWMPGSIRIMY